MSKVRLTGSNSGYVEIAAAADAGNLTFTMPTSGTALLGNNNNVFSGITTTGQLDINGSIDVSSTSVFNDDLTLTGASYNVLWDKSDNQLEFGDNAKISFGGSSDLQLWHNGTHSNIKNSTGRLYILANDIWIKDGNDGDIHARFLHDDASELYFDNSKKLETTNVGVTVTGTVTATSFSGSGANLTGISAPLSFRNLIINGAFQVAQRGTSHGSSGYRTVDRFQFSGAGLNAALTTAQVDVASGTTPYTLGFRKAYKLTNGAQTGPDAGDTMVFLYRAEAQDIANSGWNYASSSSFITLSYWIKSSVAQNFFVTLKSGDGTPQKYATETGSLSANTWTKVTKTIPGNSNLTFNNDNGEGLEIEWSIFRGTSQTGSMSLNAWAANNNSVRTPDQTSTFFTTNGATFEITGVQLEVGSSATTFEHRSFADELQRCKRYFNMYSRTHADSGNEAVIANGFFWSNSRFMAPLRFDVPMRTNSWTLYKVVGSGYFRIYNDGGGSHQINDFGLNGQAHVQSAHLNITDATSSGEAGMFFTHNAAARIGFDAEL